MIPEQSCAGEYSSEETIGLTVHWNGMSRRFEFSCHSDRCVTAGSAPGVDLYLNGVAPIAFYLERVGAKIRLTPAYVDVPLRVDAQPVAGARWIDGPATVDIAEHRLSLVIGAALPVGSATVAANSNVQFDGRRRASAIDAASTTSEFVSPPIGQSLRPLATVVIAPEQPKQAGALPATTAISRDLGVPAQRVFGERATPIPQRDVANSCVSLEPMPVLALGNFPAVLAAPAELAPSVDVQRTVAIGPAEIAALASVAIQRSALAVPAATPNHRQVVVPQPALPLAATSSTRSDKQPDVHSPAAPISSAQNEAPQPVANGLSVEKSSSMARKKSVSESTVVELPVVNISGSNSRARVASDVGVTSDAPSTSSVHRSKSISHDRAASTLARLGILTKRYPVGVIGGSIAGAILLGVFLVGMGQILGLSPEAKPHAHARSAEQVAAYVPPRGSTVAPLPELSSVAPTPPASLGAAEADNAIERAPATHQPKSLADPNLTVAVNHLFSGRLLEAEQTYHALALRYPEESSLVIAARLLSRRNGPECRPSNTQQRACPTVKQ